MMASSAASTRLAVSAKTSEIRAPVNANVRQKVDTASHSLEAAYTNASLSLADKIFAVATLIEKEPVHGLNL